MVKGYEFEKDKFVLFTPEELKNLEEAGSHVIEIVAFIPEKSVDPLYYDKAYLLAPDKRGGKPYALLQRAMQDSGRCALAKWAWKAKQYVVQVRASDEGLVLQQLLYADEVRSFKELGIEHVDVSKDELKLALQLVDQIAEDEYDPTQFVDEEKQRVLAAIDQKIEGKQIVASAHAEDAAGGAQIIDLVSALQASLGKKPSAKTPTKVAGKTTAAAPTNVTTMRDAKERKGVKRAPKAAERAAAPAPAPKARARK